MMKFLAVPLVASFLVLYVNGDCFYKVGCDDAAQDKQFGVKQRWKRSSDPCYSCECIATNFTVLVCKVGIDEILEPEQTPLKKKSVISDPSHRSRAAEYTERVKITRDEEHTLECPPTRAPVFNMETMAIEEVPYKNIVFYVERKISSCCSRHMRYTSIPDECKIVPVNECYGRAVLKADPKQRCNVGRITMVG